MLGITGKYWIVDSDGFDIDLTSSWDPKPSKKWEKLTGEYWMALDLISTWLSIVIGQKVDGRREYWVTKSRFNFHLIIYLGEGER